MQFAVRNRWTGKVQFTAEIEADETTATSWKLRLAVIWAIKTGANLREADLRAANLREADLRAANLRAANLSAANLRAANLREADLRAANLSAANLRAADLSAADLRAADLSAANLREADLRAANLSAADLSAADLRETDLRAANLREADLSAANLRIARADIWQILLQNRAEIPSLLAALREGKIDGSVYSGACACLMGTIANIRGCDVYSLERDYRRPAERWFLALKPGDTPENSQVAKITEEWILEFQALIAEPEAA